MLVGIIISASERERDINERVILKQALASNYDVYQSILSDALTCLLSDARFSSKLLSIPIGVVINYFLAVRVNILEAASLSLFNCAINFNLSVYYNNLDIHSY